MMNMKRLIAVLGLSVAVLSGCASNAQVVPAPPPTEAPAYETQEGITVPGEEFEYTAPGVVNAEKAPTPKPTPTPTPTPEPTPEPSETPAEGEVGTPVEDEPTEGTKDSSVEAPSRGGERVNIPVSEVKQYAYYQVVDTYNWDASEFTCLDNLWEKESNWRYTAENPSSGAYGIPQSLPGNKMAAAGSDWRTNPETQIDWGLDYIEGRYTTPCAAWAHSQRRNWY